jgi:hypothetical protein
MIAFACGLMIVTCSWFGFNTIIVTHLFEVTFEFAHVPIVKDNKLRSESIGFMICKDYNVLLLT